MESIIIILYNILITVFFILVLPFFSAFAKRRRTVLKRLGLTGIKTDKNISPVWIHALSVGELTAVVPLIDQLRNFYGKNEIVVSVTTKTGYVVANNLLKKKVLLVLQFPR